MRMSWKLLKTTFEPSGFSFQRYHCWYCETGFSESDKTIPTLNFFERYTAEDFAQNKAEEGFGHGSG